MRHGRDVGTGGERLFDRPFLAPSLAQPELQSRPDFGGSGNPIDCPVAPRVQKLDLYQTLSHRYAYQWAFPDHLLRSDVLPDNRLILALLRRARLSEPIYEELKARVAELERKAARGGNLEFKVSEKGAISV